MSARRRRSRDIPEGFREEEGEHGPACGAQEDGAAATYEGHDLDGPGSNDVMASGQSSPRERRRRDGSSVPRMGGVRNPRTPVMGSRIPTSGKAASHPAQKGGYPVSRGIQRESRMLNRPTLGYDMSSPGERIPGGGEAIAGDVIFRNRRSPKSVHKNQSRPASSDNGVRSRSLSNSRPLPSAERIQNSLAMEAQIRSRLASREPPRHVDVLPPRASSVHIDRTIDLRFVPEMFENKSEHRRFSLRAQDFDAMLGGEYIPGPRRFPPPLSPLAVPGGGHRERSSPRMGSRSLSPRSPGLARSPGSPHSPRSPGVRMGTSVHSPLSTHHPRPSTGQQPTDTQSITEDVAQTMEQLTNFPFPPPRALRTPLPSAPDLHPMTGSSLGTNSAGVTCSISAPSVSSAGGNSSSTGSSDQKDPDSPEKAYRRSIDYSVSQVSIESNGSAKSSGSEKSRSDSLRSASSEDSVTTVMFVDIHADAPLSEESSGSDIMENIFLVDSDLELEVSSWIMDKQTDESFSVDGQHLSMIYTDWANHYLEKTRHKRCITDLQTDICDGVLLADVIEAVTNEKVRDINQKPRSSTQMVENIQTCLSYLTGLGVAVDGLSAQDIKDGNLKSILGLFFSLSRYKQQQKAQVSAQADHSNQNTPSPKRANPSPSPKHQPGPSGDNLNGNPNTSSTPLTSRSNINANGNTEMLSRLPSPFKGSSKCPTVTHPSAKDPPSSTGTNSSSIGSSNLNRLAKGSYSSVDRRQQGAAHNNNNTGLSSLTKPATGNRDSSTSRSTSPSSSTSGIPTPGGRTGSAGPAQRTGTASRLTQPRSQSAGGKPAQKQAAGTNTASSPSATTPTGSNASSSIASPSSTTTSSKRPASAGQAGKNSMLDKFKLFGKDKDKGKDKSSKTRSSSAGTSKGKASGERVSLPSPTGPPPDPPVGAAGGGSPKTQQRGLKKFGKTRKDGPAVSGSLSREELSSRRTSGGSGIPGSSGIPGGRAQSAGVSRTTSSNSVARTASSNSVSSVSSSTNGTSGRRVLSAGTKQDKSPTDRPSSSKIASLGKSSSKSKTSIATGIPAPGSASTIPKPSSRGHSNGSHSNSGHNSVQRAPKEESSRGKSGREVSTLPGGSKGHREGSQGQGDAVQGIRIHRALPSQPPQPSQTQQGVVSEPSIAKSVKVNNTNLVAREQGAEKVSKSLQDQNANPRSDRKREDHVKPSGKEIRSHESRLQERMAERQAEKKRSKGVKVDSDTQTQASVLQHTPGPQTALPPGQVGVRMGTQPQSKAQVRSLPQPGQAQPQGARVQSPAGRSASPRTAQTERGPHHLSAGGKEASSSSINSTSSNISSGGDESNLSSDNSKSNSNNSASSNDSVIFRPSSCDELESGMESDGGYHTPVKQTPAPKPATDHISLLRQQKAAQQAANGSASPASHRKKETTFDTEVRTTEKMSAPSSSAPRSPASPAGKSSAPSSPASPAGRHSNRSSGRPSNGRPGEDEVERCEIKPMQPITRSSNYAYLKGYGSSQGLSSNGPRPSINLPGLSQSGLGSGSASSRLGVNRPLIDPSRVYMSSMRRLTHAADVVESDYGSDAEFDVSAGYMSDGDILRASHTDDINSGYLSEGGASAYAKRMQQRFREGMQAVKECMEKSNNLLDTDSFDDSSSISSGEISDTINEISTDEALTNSSLSGGGSDRVNPYSSLKRAPVSNGNALTAPSSSLATRSLPSRTSNLLHGPKASNTILGRNLNPDRLSDRGIGAGEQPASSGKESLENILGENWTKYCIGDDLTGFERGSLERSSLPVSAKERNDLKGLGFQSALPAGAFIKKKTNQATITDLRSRSLRNGGTAVAVDESEIDGDGGKKDSETNTDHSVMMLKKGQGRAPGPGGFGFRRPASASANSKSGKSPVNDAEAMRGERLSNYNKATPQKPGKTSSGSQTYVSGSQTYPRSESVDGAPHYSQASLDRKKGPLVPKSGYASLDRKARTSAEVKDRLFGSRSSLNKPGTPDGQNLISSTIISNPHATFSRHHGKPPPGTKSDGEYSPTNPYVNVSLPPGYLSPDYLPSRPLSTISPSGASPWSKGGPMRMAMSETESMESLSSIQAQIAQARNLSLQSRNILASINNPQNGIHRSDSFKSTKSEQVFPTSRADTLPRTNSFSQISSDGGAAPSSPTPSQGSGRFPYSLGAITPTSSAGIPLGLVRSNSNASNPPYANIFLPGLSKLSASKDDDLHGSSLSIGSSSSSVYSSAEDKQQQEIKKLRRELELAQEKVSTLSTQLNTNMRDITNPMALKRHLEQAHVVAAFEQSLSNMTTRLQQLTSSAEAKDTELNELRATIEALRHQSGAGLLAEATYTPGSIRRQSSNASTLSREPSLTPGSEPQAALSRHMSSDSVSSLNSLSSACSAASQQSSATDIESAKKKKKKNWLRSSFTKAFSRKPKNKNGSVSDVELDTQSLRSDTSVPNSPLLHVPHHPMSMPTTPIKGSGSSSALSADIVRDEQVLELQQALHEKDMKLTDIRLEALSSAHQLEQLRESMNRMKNEMMSLKADNERLQKMVEVKGFSPTSAHGPSIASSPPEPTEKRLSLGDPSSLDLLLSETPDREGRRITISVSQSPPGEVTKGDGKVIDVLIGAISVSGKTKWEMLDSIVRRVFKEYVIRLDPATNLGLNSDSVHGYQVGEIFRPRGKEKANIPELLPCGYLVGEDTNITVALKCADQSGVDTLAFETLIPKSIVQRYISLLQEHRRIILCGPSGTGKSYLAQKLAEYLVTKSGKELTSGSIATFKVDHKSSKELRQYLANIADQCESTAADELPNVIILDNLHHIGSLGEVFNGFLSVKYQNCPYIIGTMNQATCSTTNLQLHHNFRWVLCANHMEPVKGFLGRYLRRQLIMEETRTGMRNNDLNKIVDWMPKVWQHLNKFLEAHSSSDVTIGPRLFLSCPMDVSGAQVWFTDLWNYSIIPYMMEAVKEGLQQTGRRSAWEDPADWVISSYPWPNPGVTEWPSLLRIRPEDVGYDPNEASSTPSSPAPHRPQQAQGEAAKDAKKDGEGDQDPLLNMLMRLQEAASYSSPQSTESDNASMDSHSGGENRTEANESKA